MAAIPVASSQPVVKERLVSGSKDEPDQDEEGDDDEVIETNGKWQKLADPVTQRDVPGIDAAHLAVDNEEGMEVVWNEVYFSSESKARNKDTLLKNLEQLTSVKHPNIVKFYAFWYDGKISSGQERLVFITEYMTSGTLLQFLKKSKNSNKHISDKMWRRWCRQILSAVLYLHKQEIVHGNLTLDTIFIQHNGLVKIGSISPQNIKNVKTSLASMGRNNYHYLSPEIGDNKMSSAVDVYAFGICSLEMMVLDLLGNGDVQPKINKNDITQAVATLDTAHKKFIEQCLNEDATQRSSVNELLMSPIVQEVYSLMNLAAKVILDGRNKQLTASSDDPVSRHGDPTTENLQDPNRIVAWCSGKALKASEKPPLDPEKYFEENHVDLYQLQDTMVSLEEDQSKQPKSVEETSEASDFKPETRKVTNGSSEIKVEGSKKQIMIKLCFEEDRLERNLVTELHVGDDPDLLVNSLITNGLIDQADYDKVKKIISDKFPTIQDLL